MLRTRIGTACVDRCQGASHDKHKTHVSELAQAVVVQLAHFGNEGDGSKEYTVVAICEEVLRLCDEVIGELGDLFDDSQGTERSLKGGMRRLRGRNVECTFLRM